MGVEFDFSQIQLGKLTEEQYQKNVQNCLIQDRDIAKKLEAAGKKEDKQVCHKTTFFDRKCTTDRDEED